MSQDSSMQWVWVWLWVSITMAFDRTTEWFEASTCSARAEDPRSPFFKASAVFTKTMVQVPTRLANVGAGAFSTWDAVHHTFPAIGWYWVLGVHKLLPQGPVGTESNLDG